MQLQLPPQRQLPEYLSGGVLSEFGDADLRGVPEPVQDLYLCLHLHRLYYWLSLLWRLSLLLPLRFLLPSNQQQLLMQLPGLSVPLQHLFLLFDLSQLRRRFPLQRHVPGHLSLHLLLQLHLRTLPILPLRLPQLHQLHLLRLHSLRLHPLPPFRQLPHRLSRSLLHRSKLVRIVQRSLSDLHRRLGLSQLRIALCAILRQLFAGMRYWAISIGCC